MPARDGYTRAIFVQEMTGHCVDVPGSMILGAATPTVSERTIDIDGVRRVVARRHVLNLPIINECHITALRRMCQQQWPVTAYLLGWKRHQVWAVAEMLDVLDERSGPGTMAGGLVRLQSNIFQGAIFQSDNLLEGYPWTCTEVLQFAEDFGSGSGAFGSGSGSNQEFGLFRQNQTGWRGPFWDPFGRGASVDFSGTLVKSGNNDPTLTWILPIEGARIKLEGDQVALSIFYFDWTGNLLGALIKTASADDATGTVPTGTWTIEASVDEANVQPRMLVTFTGVALDPRTGITVGDDKLQVGIPEWTT